MELGLEAQARALLTLRSLFGGCPLLAGEESWNLLLARAGLSIGIVVLISGGWLRLVLVFVLQLWASPGKSAVSVVGAGILVDNVVVAYGKNILTCFAGAATGIGLLCTTGVVDSGNVSSEVSLCPIEKNNES